MQEVMRFVFLCLGILWLHFFFVCVCLINKTFILKLILQLRGMCTFGFSGIYKQLWSPLPSSVTTHSLSILSSDIYCHVAL